MTSQLACLSRAPPRHFSKLIPRFTPFALFIITPTPTPFLTPSNFATTPAPLSLRTLRPITRSYHHTPLSVSFVIATTPFSSSLPRPVHRHLIISHRFIITRPSCRHTHFSSHPSLPRPSLSSASIHITTSFPLQPFAYLSSYPNALFDRAKDRLLIRYECVNCFPQIRV